jgi:NADH dehydrogenase [ubiquinone] 1 alpha subcomplex assembly factor 7
MSPLEGLISARIAASGPITVAEYMETALGHPEHGYYMKGDPFGVTGDFITAPEISQVFGELIGLWAAVTWQQIGQQIGQQTGSAQKTALVECGPGRGTLMRDLLRAAKSVPAFSASIDIHLVETSPALRERQKTTLVDYAPQWHDSLDTVPEGPTILIANEFLDALPIRQLVKTEAGWAERRIGLEERGLTFETGEIVLDADRLIPVGATAADGAIFEICPAAQKIADILNRRMSRAPGAALFIDYGHLISSPGDTLQAVQEHRYANVLLAPGDADVTAHVDFGAFGHALRGGGSRTMGPVTQSAFLKSLGIIERTEKLARGATPEAAAIIRSASQRLTAPDQMGDLFKVMVATHADSPTLAGFETGMNSEC